MRELLFRAKTLSHGWRTGFIGYTKDPLATQIFWTEYNGIELFTKKDYVFQETIGQYTGLTDDKGVKIFEGDIVAFRDGHDGYLSTEQFCEGTVLWDDETMAFYLTNRIEAESHECLSECVIIGNIHDKEVDGDDEK